MKKLIFVVILLIITLPLFAQNKVFREARIFVPPIAGFGRPADNVFFYRQLSSEVVFMYYSLVRSQRGCDYILKATIIPFGMEETESQGIKRPIPENPNPPLRNYPREREYFSWEIDDDIYFYDTAGEGNYDPNVRRTPSEPFIITDDHECTLRLELINNITGDALGRQQLVYAKVDASVGDLLSIIVYNMLSGIPSIEETNDWRDKWLFLETSFLWAPRIYTEKYESVNWINFGLRAAFEFHFTNFLSLGIGTQFVQDWIVTEKYDEGHRDLILEIPIALKLVLKPAAQFVVEPYGGFAFNISLMNATIPSPASWLVGLQFGVKAGPGMIVIDPRFSMDFSESSLVLEDKIYQRNSMQIGIGYKIGFLLKRSMLDY
ncbi:MAG: hypothetical protein FWC09_12090 [Lachnospiraceae bacterium]|nr:hypothetical protein [Lachnospiraceae bacterium]